MKRWSMTKASLSLCCPTVSGTLFYEGLRASSSLGCDGEKARDQVSFPSASSDGCKSPGAQMDPRHLRPLA
ncbi:hypothetical protein M514_28396 [Trichuris suis]|uniref:Secreted protein n=1 Tax=Trichuris suis TaxID=68888 RepID=A0A085MQC9_9BILA|nr:hypothetical protein M514_28396 [Trichuris suis]